MTGLHSPWAGVGSAQPTDGANPGYRVAALCWKIRDRPVYLLSSLHFGPPGGFSHCAEVMAAFDAAHTVYFEVTKADLGVVPGLARRLTGSLSEDLEPELYRQISSDPRYSKHYETIKLPFVLTELAAHAYKEIGLTREWGVEKVLHARAASKGQKTEGLECATQLISRLDMIDTEPLRRALQKTLNEPDYAREARDQVVMGYLQGNDYAMGMAREKMITDTPELARCILIEREALWRPRLRAICEGDSPAVVVLGALHFAGENSVLTALQQDGIKVDPFGS